MLRLPDWLSSLAVGSLELTSGIAAVQQFPVRLRFLLCTFLVSWGGICVHLQAAEALLAAKLPVRRYLAGKLMQALISSLLAFMLAPFLFPLDAPYPIWSMALSAFFLFSLIFFSFFQKMHWKKRRIVI